MPNTISPVTTSTPAASPSPASSSPAARGGAATPAGTNGARKYAGKYDSPEALETAYTEINSKFGSQGEELGKWRQYGEQASNWMNSWRPALERLNFDPNALATLLERQAQQYAAQGQTGAAAQSAAQAQQARSWADALTPQDQEAYIQRYVGDTYTEREKVLLQQLGSALQERDQYWNRFADYALQAMQAVAKNPQLDITTLLQSAVTAAKSAQSNPISAAVQQMTAPQQWQSWIKQHDDEQRKAWEADQANRALTTGAVAGGAPPSRGIYRIPETPGAPASPAPITRERDAFAAAKDRAIPRIAALFNSPA